MDQKSTGDTFIGLDISVEDDMPTASRSSNKQSRKRPIAQSTTVAKKRLKRPPPTPAPPSELVSLIQRNNAVLQYFKSLQANLDHDVEKWKAEAQKWKQIAQDKSNGASTNIRKTTATRARGQHGRKSRVGTHQTKKLSATVDMSEAKVSGDYLTAGANRESRPLTLEQDDDTTIPITDEVLFEGSDDSHDEQSNFCEETMLIQIETAENISNRTSAVVEKLKEAKKCLDLLGVSLVEVEVKIATPAGAETKSGEELERLDDAEMHNSRMLESTVERILHRQSDENVAGDIMASLKALIRASSCIAESTSGGLEQQDENIDRTMPDSKTFWSKIMHQYHPFCHDGKKHIPAVYQPCEDENLLDEDIRTLPAHPAAVGLIHVINILSILDTYCSDALSDSQWDALFEIKCTNSNPFSEEELMVLKAGMRNRCRVTNRVMSSLEVEITRSWALIDRASYLAEPTLFFHESDVTDVDCEPQLDATYHAKLYNRLVSLEERIAHARIATVIYRQKDDWQKAAELVVGYVVSCAPSIEVEDHPRLPPALSMCVLESLLSSVSHYRLSTNKRANDKNENQAHEQGWFRRYIHFLFEEHNCDIENKVQHAVLLLNALAYPIHVAALIWKERSICTDQRIRDVALIELAAFQRMKLSSDGEWLCGINVGGLDTEVIMGAGNRIFDSINAVQEKTVTDDEHISLHSVGSAVAGMIMALSLLTMGNVDKVILLCDSTKSSLTEPNSRNVGHNKANQRIAGISVMPLLCSVYVSLMTRKWDALKLSNGWGRQTAAAFTVVDRFTPILESLIRRVGKNEWNTFESLMQCCVLLCDGRNLLRIANTALPTLVETVYGRKNNQSVQSPDKCCSAARMMASLIDIGEIPTVRVINLERRPDRLLNFMSIASKEQVVVIKGPIDATKYYDENEDCAGHHAFDGKCTFNEIKELVSTRLGGDFSDFVTSKWRPGDLRAFDRNARKSQDLVQTSLTEMACALSHIASWIGVKRSLSEQSSTNVIEGEQISTTVF